MSYLVNLTSFEKVLKNYRPDSDYLKQLQQLNLVLLLGFSGAGKNTIINYLKQHYDYYFLVSDTTRKPRRNNGLLEADGVDYNFISLKKMLENLKKGNYLEAEIIHDQQVSGISIQQLLNALKVQKRAITDVDLGGAQKILTYKNDSYLFLVLPPSFEIWMKRLLKRDQNMTVQELLHRLKTAQKILKAYQKGLNCQIIINVDYHQSAEEINSICQNKIKPTKKIKEEKLITYFDRAINKFLNSFSTLDS